MDETVGETMEPGLFTQPIRRDGPMDGPWHVASGTRRWRFALVGDDGEYLVIYGHDVPADDVPALLMHRQIGYGPEEAAEYANDGPAMQRRWCGWVTVCEDHHPPLLPDTDCWSCTALDGGALPERWWWWGPQDEPEKYRNRPGFFPITLVDLEY
jgi:hypothetical protein